MNNRALTIAAVILIGWAVVRHVDRNYFSPGIHLGFSRGVCLRDHGMDAEVEQSVQRNVEATVRRSVESSLASVDAMDVDLDDNDVDVNIDMDDVYGSSDGECLRERLRENIIGARDQVMQERDEVRGSLDANHLDRERVRDEIRRSMREARDQWREDMRGSLSEMRQRRSELRSQMRERREELKKEIRQAVRQAKDNHEIY